MRVTTVEEADAVRFVKHEAEKRAVTSGAHGPLGHHATQAAVGHAANTAHAVNAQRNLLAAFNAA